MRGNPHSYQAIAHEEPGYSEEPEVEDDQSWRGVVFGDDSLVNEDGTQVRGETVSQTSTFHLGDGRFLSTRITAAGIRMTVSDRNGVVSRVDESPAHWMGLVAGINAGRKGQ